MRRRYHLRLPFWIYCGLTVLVALAAMNGQSSLLFWVFGLMASALLVSGAVSGIMMVGLRVRRVTPSHGIVGEPLNLHYAVRNRNQIFPAFNIHLRERGVPNGAPVRPHVTQLLSRMRAWVMHIGPGESVHGEAVFRPVRRGSIHFDQLQVATTFPFGIVGKSVTISQPQHIRIYPRLYTLNRRVLDAIIPVGPVGTKITNRAGAGDDYYGLREFRPGDSMRSISWKRTANRDQLVCIEHAQPSPPRVRVILNLTRPTAKLARGGPGNGSDDPGHDAFQVARDLEEAAISLAASVVHAADLARYEVGLTVLGIEHAPIPVRRSHWHRNRIMVALAEIDLDAERVHTPVAAVAERERVGVIVLHPSHPEVTLVPGDAWHFSAARMEHLVQGPLDTRGGDQSVAGDAWRDATRDSTRAEAASDEAAGGGVGGEAAA